MFQEPISTLSIKVLPVYATIGLQATINTQQAVWLLFSWYDVITCKK